MSKDRSAARTDVGMKREHNEVSFLVNEDQGLFVVRDGMGGHAGGETASRMAVQVRAGLLTDDEARHSRLKNIITRSVGFEEDVLVDVICVETRAGDKFLLCSDGLSNLIESAEIRDALVETDLAKVPEILIQ